jgi:hypothetical protein
MKAFKKASLNDRIEALDWERLGNELLENGFVVTEPFLNSSECDELKCFYDEDDLFRSTIDMKRHGFGKGQVHDGRFVS